MSGSQAKAPGFAGGYLLTDAVVYLSTKVPLLYAPIVTTYLSLAIQSLPVLLIIAFRRQLQLAPWALLAFVILLVGMRQADEVQSNSINLHFHLTLLAVVIMLLSQIAGNWRFLFRGFLLICGLGGILPNILLPVFVVKAGLERDRESLIQALIVGATTMVQISFLLYSADGLSARLIEFVPVLAVIATLAQQYVVPFSPLILFEDWASWLRALTSHRSLAIGLAAISLTGILCFYAWCISA